MTPLAAPYQSGQAVGRDGFVQLVHAEWTKFRTVRGWLAGLLGAGLVTVLVGLLSVVGSHRSCGGDCSNAVPIGPGGEAVTDRFYFVHQPFAGDGSITVRVTSLTGLIPSSDDGPAREDPVNHLESGVQAWAKAGLIIKDSTEQGSTYAAVMVTGDHGVRMQYDYTHDIAAQSGEVSETAPRWLRLTRSGATITGYESTDGTRWTQVGSAHLSDLSPTAEAGLFVTSPAFELTTQHLGSSSSVGGPTQATASFDEVSLEGQWPDAGWTGDEIGGSTGGISTPLAGFDEANGTFTLSGLGDIAPQVAGPEGDTIERSLVGAFAGLILLIVVATMFIAAEYRRGLIRTTLAASPRRGHVLAAKAVVIGGFTFVVGLAATTVAVTLIGKMRRDSGENILTVSSLTEWRVIAGTAALLAVTAVLATAVGAVLRRGAATAVIVIVVVVLPYILAVSSVLPVGAAQWVLRVTPAAAFAIQQSSVEYAQVAAAYTPSAGYFPLAPWAGFAVLCAWTSVALGLATVLLRRRDA